jgi:beta-1,4-mannosyltransferase
MHIVFDPKTSKTNQYVVLITTLLAEHGINTYSVDEVFSDSGAFKKTKIVHLNWYENLVSGTPSAVVLSFLKKTTKLLVFFVTGKKMVWTMHNKMSHVRDLPFLNKWMFWLMVHLSERIVIHCHVSQDILKKYGSKILDKTTYIPHPDYVGIYGDVVLSLPDADESNVLKLLFLGAVKPYKNIELLIDVAKSLPNDLVLTVAGKPMNEEYEKALVECASNMPNIIFDFRYIPDALLPTYMSKSDLLVLPYDTNSSLNSGAAILAFSYGKTVICPQIGTIADLKSEDYILSYQYQTEKEHLSELSENVKKAILLKKANIRVFEQFGSEMYKCVSIKNDKKLVVNELAKLYTDLMSN